MERGWSIHLLYRRGDICWGHKTAHIPAVPFASLSLKSNEGTTRQTLDGTESQALVYHCDDKVSDLRGWQLPESVQGFVGVSILAHARRMAVETRPRQKSKEYDCTSVLARGKENGIAERRLLPGMPRPYRADSRG